MNMISFPKFLFLDEPTTGMGIQSRRAIWKMILKIKEIIKFFIYAVNTVSDSFFPFMSHIYYEPSACKRSNI